MKKENLIIHKRTFKLYDDTNIFKACLCILEKKTSVDMSNNIKFLHKNEIKYLESIKAYRRINSFLMGRYIAKEAILELNPNTIPMNTIEVRSGIFGQPYIVSKDIANTNLSISHIEEVAVSVAFDEGCEIGIDVEKVDEGRRSVLESICSYEEIKLFNNIISSYDEILTAIWTIKEAIGKVLKVGIAVNLDIFKIKNVSKNENNIVVLFNEFPQYQAIVKLYNNAIISIVLPKKLKYININ